MLGLLGKEMKGGVEAKCCVVSDLLQVTAGHLIAQACTVQGPGGDKAAGGTGVKKREGGERLTVGPL